jgi:hypothetical protein
MLTMIAIQLIASIGMRRRLRRSMLLLLPALLLSACQSINQRAEEIREARRLPEAGSRFVLNTTLPVEPNKASVIIQNGEIKAKPNLYVPWCTLHVYRPRDGFEKATEIQSGEFTIDQSYRRYDYSSLDRSDRRLPVMVAASDIWDIDSGNQTSNVTQSVYFVLRSPDQPQIRQLVCSIFADPTQFAYPNLSEIKTALGSVASINQP